MDSIDLQLALGRAPKLTGSRLREISTSRAIPLRLPALYRCSPTVRKALRKVNPAQIASDRRFVEQQAISLLDITCDEYPPLLAQIADPPALLYVKGKIAALKSAQLAMAGARTPSESGRRIARRLAQQFASIGLTITAGLDAGIDAACHEGALTAGRTIAVLGTGLDRIDQIEHTELAARVSLCGAVISEFPPGLPPEGHFGSRHRIISGLSLATLVIEARCHSTAVITARLACEQQREVFAVPGSIDNPMVSGCHALIRDGAKMVEGATDVLEELKFIVPEQMLTAFENNLAKARARLFALDKEYKILLDALGFESTGFNDLVARTGFPSQSVASMLLILELEGAVGLQAGGQYVRL